MSSPDQDPKVAASEVGRPVRSDEEVIDVRRGMFGVRGSVTPPATDGWCGRSRSPGSSPRPYGGYFDEVVDRLAEALKARRRRIRRRHRESRGRPRRADPARAPGAAAPGRPASSRRAGTALRAVPGRQRGALPARDGPRTARRLPAAVDHAQSPRPRWKCAAPDSDPHIPSLYGVYPTSDWHERETYDFFGIIFDGHPSLTRIEMPDDWHGHPQRKDYPLGGIPVEYKGAQIPPPDERRALQLMSTTTDSTHDGGAVRPSWSPGGQDWEQDRRGRPQGGSRRTHRRQHGPPAPVHPRGVAADPRDRRRDGHRGPLRNRLPAHRNREEPRIPLLDPGRHLRDPNGLPGTVFQRDRLLPGRGEAARHHRRDPGAGQRHPGDDDGAQPDLLASGRAGHRRHGTGRHDADVRRIPRTRDRPDPVRDRSPGCG